MPFYMVVACMIVTKIFGWSYSWMDTGKYILVARIHCGVDLVYPSRYYADHHATYHVHAEGRAGDR
jgi:hypothetical protein